MKKLGAGIRQTVSFKNLKKVDIIRPPVTQQTTIANFLDTETSKIDLKVSTLEKKLNLLEKYKQSLIYEAVTKGLDSNAPMKDSGIEWVGEIPANWEVRRLKDVAVIKKGDIFDYNQSSSDGLYPYINGGMQPSGWSNCFNTNGNTVTVAEGGASSGYTQYMATKYWAGQHCYKIKLKNYSPYNKYLFYMLKGFENHLIRERTGVAMPNLPKTKFANYLISFTYNSKEQQQIVNYLDKKIMIIDKQKELITKQTILLKEYKQSLIYEAVTGKLEITQ